VGRRRFFPAGLAALTLGVAVLLVVFTVLPIRSCPTCKGIAKKVSDPGSGTVPVHIGCPECGDRGSVTEPRRWKGSLVPAQVTRLLQCWRPERTKEFLPCFSQVVTLSGRDPEEVLGTKTFGSQWTGAAVFVRAEGKGYVLVLLHGDDRRWNGLEGLLLLGMDGRVLDYVQAAGLNGWHLEMDLLDPKDDGIASIRAQRMFQPEEVGEVPLKVLLEGSGRSLPMPPGSDPKHWLVRVKGGRFEIVSAPKDRAP
jgi:hypothetical protein